MASTINRASFAVTDDDGSKTTGTPFDNAWYVALADAVDALFSSGEMDWGAAGTDYWRMRMGGAFTSGGGATQTAALEIDGTISGVSGDTSLQTGTRLNNAITTQGSSEVVADVAQLTVEEPQVTVGTGDTVTNASALLVVAAPTEGTNNFFAKFGTTAGLTQAGKLGVGTVSPSAVVHASSSASDASNPSVQLTRTSTGQDWSIHLDDDDFRIRDADAGADYLTIFDGTGGVNIGSPTGGDKGAGTLNCAGDIYKNNTAYTNPDYVLEQWATGRIEAHRDAPGAAHYQRVPTLAEIESHIRATFQLPGPSPADVRGVFARADWLLERVEEAFVHLIELGHRIAALEEEVS